MNKRNGSGPRRPGGKRGDETPGFRKGPRKDKGTGREEKRGPRTGSGWRKGEEDKKPGFRGGPKTDWKQKDKTPFRRDGEKKGRYSEKSEKPPRTRKFLDKDQEIIGNWRSERPGANEAEQVRKPIAGEVRLNKYLSNSGICSRRDADGFIENGQVTVNGVVVKELGSKVKPGDEVRFKGRLVLPEKAVYLLLNKPKDCITSLEDPEGRKTVMDLIDDSISERIFPVGRLDRNTTGVLLLTNDGDLAQKLTHPSYGTHKVYKATLDKPMLREDFEKLLAGVELEDGFIQPDALAYVDETMKEIGIEIHSGKNHVVHRMFNSLGYLVDKLDRVMFAGLSKDGLKRGESRVLSAREVQMLYKASGKKKSNDQAS